MKRRAAIALALATLATGLATAGAAAAGLRLNTTASMPRGIWRVVPVSGAIRRNEIVVVCPSNFNVMSMAMLRGYIAPGRCPEGFEPLIKPVVAVAGDVVRVSADGITVNGTLLPNSVALAHDPAGRPLQPVRPGTYRVQPGQVWILSEYNSRSLDSRYLGTIPITDIKGIGYPVWIWR